MTDASSGGEDATVTLPVAGLNPRLPLVIAVPVAGAIVGAVYAVAGSVSSYVVFPVFGVLMVGALVVGFTSTGRLTIRRRKGRRAVRRETTVCGIVVSTTKFALDDDTRGSVKRDLDFAGCLIYALVVAVVIPPMLVIGVFALPLLLLMFMSVFLSYAGIALFSVVFLSTAAVSEAADKKTFGGGEMYRLDLVDGSGQRFNLARRSSRGEARDISRQLRDVLGFEFPPLPRRERNIDHS